LGDEEPGRPATSAASGDRYWRILRVLLLAMHHPGLPAAGRGEAFPLGWVLAAASAR
jgi:hypothetical protein